MNLNPGSYVVAVSGGVDSMVLLRILSDHLAINKKNVKVIVAHFDHGIRTDSNLDRMLVQKTARNYGLPFVYQRGKLGKEASENDARKARYEFLRALQRASNSTAIMTAHHQDDLLETAILNILRGTGRKGLSSLRSHRHLIRPLLGSTKEEIRQYAHQNDLMWREDSTNSDMSLRRNYVRKRLLPRFDNKNQQKLLDLIHKFHALNQEIDEALQMYLHAQPSVWTLNRQKFIQLPHTVANEVIATWLRNHNIKDFDKKFVDKLTIQAKTLPAGKKIDVNAHFVLAVEKDLIRLVKINK